MAAVLHLLDQRRLIDSNGISDGGSLAFYLTGTTTLATIYADAGLTTPRANPVVVGAGAAIPQFYLDGDVTYRRVITYSDGSTDTTDPYTLPDYLVTAEGFADAAEASADDAADSAAAAAASEAMIVAALLSGGAFTDTTVAAAVTAGLAATSSGGFFIATGDDIDEVRQYKDNAGTAVLIFSLPKADALNAAVDAAAASAAAAAEAVIPLYTQSMKSAVGSGTLNALFDMDGPRTAYAGSPTIMTALESLEGNATSLGLYGTIYSGTDPRPVYTAGRGIYFSGGAGFETTTAMIPGTDREFAFLYSVDLNTLTSTVGLEASLPGSPTDGDNVKVNADRNVAVGLGNDVPVVLNTAFSAVQLVNGYFTRSAYYSDWYREVFLFKATGTGGQRFECKITHLGQLQFFAFDGTNSVTLMSKGRVVMEQGILTFALRNRNGYWSMTVDGETVHGAAGPATADVDAITQWYFNGSSRVAAVGGPVNEGIRHYWKGMAIATDLPDDAAFERLYNTFAQRHGAVPLQAPRQAYGIIYMGQSWATGSTSVNDLWTHGANSWNGEITTNNASYAQEAASVIRDSFANVFASRSMDAPADIAAVDIQLDASGNIASASSHYGGGSAETIKGWAAQVNQHDEGQNADWYVAVGGLGAASIAMLTSQTITPLMSQLKTAPIGTGNDDIYLRTIRQVVYHRDMALAKGQTYSVRSVLWQQGHQNASDTAYTTALRTLYDKICVDVMQITGQNYKPTLFAPQINYSTDGTANSTAIVDQEFLDMEDERSTSLPTGDTVPRPWFCIGPMYQITNFIHAYRSAHGWIGELFGKAFADVEFDGQSYTCLRPYAFTLGANYIDIDYRVRSGRSIIVNATNENQVPGAVTNAGFIFTDASGGGVAISGVAATDSNTIRISLSGAPAAGDTIAYLGTTARTGNVADGAAVDGIYRDQDWTVSFTAGEPTFKTDTGEYNDLRQWGVAFTKVLP